ncbi:hypothetical protein [Fodinibius halophilus]|uniref:Uncharacterized protein n=1 Tax=Fodinibius halophilus TaxID=1736908 RepID=A0A6M1T4C0_9BACT|nr:hypothetical protein [Fodinibius halophilus]NGP90256.1 hypothetical protein [Fodinibius halophilus]
MENQAKLRLSLKNGEFEISGSEEFVTEQIQNFKDIIEESIENYSPEVQQNIAPPSQGVQANQNGENKNKGIDNYKTLYDFNDEEIKILKRIPGNSKRERMVNAALLFLHAKKLKFDEEVAAFSNIRTVCEDHGFLDSKNFSAALNDANELLNCSGSGRSQEAKLTFPGEQAAEDLAKELISS